MPGSTPVFGLPYPLASDPVDPAAFANLAGAIDTALVSVAQERDAVLKKPWLSMTHFNAVGPVAPATDQTVTWDAIGANTDGMAPALGGSSITVQTPGVYTFETADFQISGYTTFVDIVTGWFVNGVRLGSMKKPATSFSGSFSPSNGAVMVWPLLAGDVVTLHWQFGGTGNATSLFCTMAATLICPLV